MNPACPACDVPTRLVHWHDLEGFECPGCRGHFIRAKQLQRFMERHGPDKFEFLVSLTRGAPPASRRLTCPGCGTRSFREVRRGIIEIDVCASCSSVYFDAGESSAYLRQSLLERFGQSAAAEILSTDDGWGDLLETFVRDFFD